MTDGTLTVLDPKEIGVEDGHNPRDEVGDLDGLIASIKTDGLLQPILVRERSSQSIADDSESPRYLVIAGHRRLAAAKKIGLAEIPALVRDLNGSGLRAAIAENVQRANLTAIEEAKAYKRLVDSGLTEKGVAETVGVPPAFVKERLGLLDLPEVAQTAMHEGSLHLFAAPTLTKIAAASPALAADFADWIITNDESTRALADNPAQVFNAYLSTRDDQERGDGPFCIAVSWSEVTSTALLNAGADTGTEEEPNPAWVKLVEQEQETAALAGNYFRGITMSDHAKKKAKAYGGTFTLKGSWGGETTFFADEAFMVDWLTGALKKRASEAKKDLKTHAPKGEAGEPLTVDQIQAAQKEQRAEERAKAQAEAKAARSANLELGAKLATKLDHPKLTTDVAKLLAGVLLRRVEHFGAAVRLTDATLQQVETIGEGEKARTKVTYLEPYEAESVIWDRIAKAKNPETVLGIVLQVLTAVRFADEKELPQSKRQHATVPGASSSFGGGWYGYDDDLVDVERLLTKVAKPSLPQSRLDEIEQAEVTRQQRAADKAERERKRADKIPVA